MSGMNGMSTPGMPSGNGENIIVHVDETALPPQGSKQVDVVFKEDSKQTPIQMACFLPGHLEAGMYLNISVN